MNTGALIIAASLAAAVGTFGAMSSGSAPTHAKRSATSGVLAHAEDAMQVQYLEVVTPDVDATCKALAATHGVTFGDPVMALGGARTAPLGTGGRIGVRGPLRPDEEPVVRPYMLVDDIQAAVKGAEAAGATIALPPMDLPGEGTCAIYILGGIDHGLWEN